MVFQGIFMIFHFLSFVSVQVSFVIVQVYLSLYYQARPRVQKVPPESHQWRCERFQTAWHVNGFGLLETWILALAWMEIPGPPAYLHQTGTLPMANVFSFWRTQAGRILTRIEDYLLSTIWARWVSRLRDSHSCEQELFLSVEGKGSPSKAPMISYNPSDMEAGVMIALRRDNIDLVSKSSEQLWMLVTSDGFLLLLASLWDAQCVGEKDETDKDQHSKKIPSTQQIKKLLKMHWLFVILIGNVSGRKGGVGSQRTCSNFFGS